MIECYLVTHINAAQSMYICIKKSTILGIMVYSSWLSWTKTNPDYEGKLARNYLSLRMTFLFTSVPKRLHETGIYDQKMQRRTVILVYGANRGVFPEKYLVVQDIILL